MGKPIEICSSPSEHKACGETTRHCRDGGQPRRGRGRRRVRRLHCAQRRAVISARFVIHSAPSYTDLRRRDDRATFRESAPCNGSPTAGCPDDHRHGVGAASPYGGEASRATSAEWRFADGRVLRRVGVCLISTPVEASSALEAAARFTLRFS